MPRPRLGAVRDPGLRFAEGERRLRDLEFGAPHPTFRAHYENAPVQEVSNASQLQLAYDFWEIGDDRFFREGGLDYYGRLTSVFVRQGYVYAMNFMVLWSGGPDWTGTCSLAIDDPYRDTVQTFDSPTNNPFDDYFVLSTVRDYWFFDVYNTFVDPTASFSQFAEVATFVNQNSGVAQDVVEADFLVYCLGQMDVQTPTKTYDGDATPHRILPE